MTTTKFIQVEQARLAYTEHGAGEQVVFVHGAFCDHRFWALQVADLAADYRCLALDQRYFGSSSTEVTGTYSLTTHASDLGAFIDAIADGPVHVVASFYGAAVALAWAAAKPRACASLFLNEPALASLVTLPEDVAVLRRARADLAPVVAALAAGDALRAIELFCDWTAFPGAFATMPPELQAIFADNSQSLAMAFSAPPPTIGPADLSPITMPVTLAGGALTSPFFLVQLQAAHRALPQSRLVAIPDSHHAAPLQNATAFNEAMRHHLREARGTAA